jgi:hypothetical protein
MGEGIKQACLYGWLLDQQWWGGSSTQCWRIIISVPSVFMINASGSSIAGKELIRLFAADSGVKMLMGIIPMVFAYLNPYLIG